MKRGDIVQVPEEQNAFNRRNGLPRYKVQEVVAVLEPGERACDYGFHEPIYGALNDGENRVLLNNRMQSRLSHDRFYWPLRHDAPDRPTPKYATVSYTRTTIVPNP